jgi:hypothetical protein
MVDRKVVPFDEFYYKLKLMHLFQKHPVYYYETYIISSKISRYKLILFKDIHTRNTSHRSSCNLITNKEYRFGTLFEF